jgi:hypothetical protein
VHLDQNRQTAEDNFAFLCFDHHDQYDSRSRQSKNSTADDVKGYRLILYAAVEHADRKWHCRALALRCLMSGREPSSHWRREGSAHGGIRALRGWQNAAGDVFEFTGGAVPTSVVGIIHTRIHRLTCRPRRLGISQHVHILQTCSAIAGKYARPALIGRGVA